MKEQLMSVPPLLAIPPKNPDNSIIGNKRDVHCRAAAAGAINIALINTMPTVCNPSTIVITCKTVTMISQLITR